MNMHHTKGRNVAHRLLISSTTLAKIAFAPTPHARDMMAAATTTDRRIRGQPEAVVPLAQ